MHLAHVITAKGPSWVYQDERGSLMPIAEPVLTTSWRQPIGIEAPVTALEWLPPVPDIGRIFCVGLNYRSHAEEAGMDLPKTPVLFAKYASSLVGHHHTTVVPAGVHQVDYEAELVIVMGAPCKDVAPSETLDYVAGYCNGNDLSARELQLATSQWLLGKTLDGFAPVGPYLVTPDAIPDPDDLAIRCWVNGELKQSDRTSSMIFSCRTIVSYLSHYVTLLPGDLIFTGTPSGVVLGKPPQEQVWLHPGDVVEVEVEGLGRLMTTIGGPPDAG